MSNFGKILTTLGLAFGVVGAGLIWRFGLPAKLDRDGHINFIFEKIDEAEKKKAKRYDFRSSIGFALLILGFLLQAIGIFI